FVLVDASSRERIDAHEKLKDKGIDPHFARLHFHHQDVMRIGSLPVAPPNDTTGMLVFALDQVVLTITNPAPPLHVDATAAECAPHLKDYIVGGIIPPNAEALHGGPAMAAFFDIPQGELHGYRRNDENGACMIVLTAQTAGDPILAITPFGATESTSITLRSGASVLVTNLPDPDAGGSDRDEDFLLYFLLTETIPTDPGYPKKDEAFSCCPVRSDLEDGGIELYVGPGCSNSVYP
ncbi:MAG: hypothetical protein WB973_18980, partial [Thermoanaerobaculia bacterium]